jgi:hypothetical protein
MTEHELLKQATVRKDELIAKFMEVSGTRDEAIHLAKRSQVDILNLKMLPGADLDDWYKQQSIELMALGLLKIESSKNINP